MPGRRKMIMRCRERDMGSRAGKWNRRGGDVGKRPFGCGVTVVMVWGKGQTTPPTPITRSGHAHTFPFPGDIDVHTHTHTHTHTIKQLEKGYPALTP